MWKTFETAVINRIYAYIIIHVNSNYYDIMMMSSLLLATTDSIDRGDV